MICGHEHYIMVVMEEPSERRDLIFGSQNGLCGEGPQCTDYLWFNSLKLFNEEGEAGADFIKFWIAVIGRPTFQNVGNIYLFSC